MRGKYSAAYLLTNCTARKSRPVTAGLSLTDLPRQTLRGLARDWAGRLYRASDRVPAEKLYQGRAMREAEAAAKQSRARLVIVSAGVGLVSAETPIPSYEATITIGHPQNPNNRVRGVSASSADWWLELTTALGQDSPVLELIRGVEPTSLVILALSRPYLAMLENELLSLDTEQLTRIRIISHGPQEWLPMQLRGQMIVYSASFDGPKSPNPGTKSDFAQRAARHFVTEILPNCATGSAGEHQSMVDRKLGALPTPKQHARKRLSDDEIIKIIKRDFGIVGGQSTKMLRHLRDDLYVSCEQRRFRTLFTIAATLDQPHHLES